MSDTYTIRLGGEVSASFFSSLNKLTGTLSGINGLLGGFTQTALGAFGGFKLAELQNDAIGAATAVGSLSKVLGTSVEDASRMEYTMEHSGVSADELKGALIHLSEWLVKNGQGSKDLKTALIELATEYQKAPPGPERLALAHDRLGRSAKDMLGVLAKGPEELERLMDRAGELGLVTTAQVKLFKQWKESTGDLHTASQSFWREIAEIGVPSMISLAEGTTSVFKALRTFLEQSPAAREEIKTLGQAAAITAGSFALFKAASVAAGRVTATNVLAFAGLTTVVAFGVKAWEAYNAEQGEALSQATLQQGVAARTTALTTQIHDLLKLGTITQQQADDFQKRVFRSMDYTQPAIAMEKIIQIYRELRQLVATPAEEAPSTAPRSLNELEQRRKAIDLQIQENRLMAEKGILSAQGLDYASKTQQRAILTAVDLTQEDKLLTEKRELLAGAINDTKLLELNEDGKGKRSHLALQMELEDQKALVEVEKRRADEKERLKRIEAERAAFQSSLTSQEAQGIAERVRTPRAHESADLTVEQGRYQAQIRQINDSEILSNKEKNSAIEQAERIHQNNILNIQRASEQKKTQLQAENLQTAGQMLGAAADAAKLFGKKGFVAWKAFALAQATVSGAAAVVQQLGSGDPYSSWFRAAAAAAVAAVQIATIATTEPSGYKAGGFTGEGGENDVAGVVHRREFVIPAQRVDEFGVGLFEGIRQGDISPEDLRGGGGSARGATSVNANFATINSRQEMRDFMAQEGWKIVYDAQQKRQRTV